MRSPVVLGFLGRLGLLAGADDYIVAVGAGDRTLHEDEILVGDDADHAPVAEPGIRRRVGDSKRDESAAPGLALDIDPMLSTVTHRFGHSLTLADPAPASAAMQDEDPLPPLEAGLGGLSLGPGSTPASAAPAAVGASSRLQRLLAGLRSDDPARQQRALERLNHWTRRDPDARVPLLVAALTADDGALLDDAIACLQPAGSPRSVAALLVLSRLSYRDEPFAGLLFQRLNASAGGAGLDVAVQTLDAPGREAVVPALLLLWGLARSGAAGAHGVLERLAVPGLQGPMRLLALFEREPLVSDLAFRFAQDLGSHGAMEPSMLSDALLQAHPVPEDGAPGPVDRPLRRCVEALLARPDTGRCGPLRFLAWLSSVDVRVREALRRELLQRSEAGRWQATPGLLAVVRRARDADAADALYAMALLRNLIAHDRASSRCVMAELTQPAADGRTACARVVEYGLEHPHLHVSTIALALLDELYAFAPPAGDVASGDYLDALLRGQDPADAVRTLVGCITGASHRNAAVAASVLVWLVTTLSHRLGLPSPELAGVATVLAAPKVGGGLLEHMALWLESAEVEDRSQALAVLRVVIPHMVAHDGGTRLYEVLQSQRGGAGLKALLDLLPPGLPPRAPAVPGAPAGGTGMHAVAVLDVLLAIAGARTIAGRMARDAMYARLTAGGGDGLKALVDRSFRSPVGTPLGYGAQCKRLIDLLGRDEPERLRHISLQIVLSMAHIPRLPTTLQREQAAMAARGSKGKGPDRWPDRKA